MPGDQCRDGDGIEPTAGMWPSNMPESIKPISPGPSSIFDMVPQIFSGSASPPGKSATSLSRPQSIHAMMTMRLVNVLVICPKRAVFLFRADPECQHVIGQAENLHHARGT